MGKGIPIDDVQSLNVDPALVDQAIETEIVYAESFVAPDRRYYATHTLGEFILMINQYAAQAMQKWTHHSDAVDGHPVSLHEVRKIAALAKRCMIQHGAPMRAVPVQSAE
jgi:hypothetical protein